MDVFQVLLLEDLSVPPALVQVSPKHSGPRAVPGKVLQCYPKLLGSMLLAYIHLEMADELEWTRRGRMSQAPQGLFACDFGFLGCIWVAPRAHSRLGQADLVL